MENYVLLRDMINCKKGQIFKYCGGKFNYTDINNVLKYINEDLVINNNDWFMKESEYNQRQEAFQKGSEKMRRTPIQIVQKEEYWKITNELQWVITSHCKGNMCRRTKTILQQKHISNLGNEKWITIPTIFKSE